MSTLFFRNRHLLTLTIAVLLVGGLSAMFTLPRLEDPRISNRNAVIVTALPGASAERVEALVTETLEDELRELSEIDEIDSISRVGVSLITVSLDGTIQDTDPVWAKVRDKLGDAEDLLPPEASPPAFDETRAPPAFTLLVGLAWSGSGEPSPGILKRLSEELADRLRNVPATDIVRVYGEAEEEIAVTVDPDELAALGLSVDEVGRRIAAADAKVPAGVLRGTERDVLIEVAGELDTLDRIARIPLRDGATAELLRLGDVATVERSFRQPQSELALIGGENAAGRPGILIAARVEANQQVDRWARQANRVIDDFESRLSGSVAIERVFDQSHYTLSRLGQLAQNLILGGLIVVAVIFVTMGWRSALLVGAAVPLSASSVLFGLNVFGVPLHQISVTGLIIALGLLIDNAIVMVEEVHHRMRKASRAEAIAQAVRHLFVPLLGSTLTTVIAFLPIFLLSGDVGEFVDTIAVSVILALISSFVIAMTVLPALVGLFGRSVAEERSQSWWRSGVRNPRAASFFRRLLTMAVRRPLLGIASGVVLPVLGFLAAGTLERQFFPFADRDQFYLQMWLPTESSIDLTRDRAMEVEAVLRRDPVVRRVDWVIGGSAPAFYYNMLMNEDGAPSYAQALVHATDDAAMRRALPELQRALDTAFPDGQIVLRLLGQGPPVDAPIEVRLFGPSLAELRRLGDEVRRHLIEMPEVVHTRATLAAGEPKLELRANESEARLAGLSLVDVARQLQGRLEGGLGGSILEQTEDLPVRIRYGDRERADLGRIAAVNLRPGAAADSDEWVPLTSLGELTLTSELRGIPRRNGERLNTLKGYLIAGALPPEVSARFAERLEGAGFELPAGYRMELGGEAEEQGDAIAGLFTHAPVLLVLMVATIVLSFRSFRLAGLLGLVAILAVGLGFLAMRLAGLPYGFMSMIGTAGLIGIAINDSIVVLAALRARPDAAAGRLEPMVDEVLGTSRHVFSTTLTTAGGFLPLLLSGGVLWPPLAVVIAGGVIGATFLALIFVPAAYAFLHRSPAAEPVAEPAANLDELALVALEVES
ncbi:MAG: efflux RND transporter permease subunit [Acidobacteriota bacterium]